MTWSYHRTPYIEIPLLRRKALAFIQDQMLRELLARSSFNQEERLLAIFGLHSFLIAQRLITRNLKELTITCGVKNLRNL